MPKYRSQFASRFDYALYSAKDSVSITSFKSDDLTEKILTPVNYCFWPVWFAAGYVHSYLCLRWNPETKMYEGLDTDRTR